MLFNSYIFIFLFLPIVLAGHYGLHYLHQYKFALYWLIGMSMWFYGYNNIDYLAVLMASILLNHLVVRRMGRCENKGKRRFWLVLGLGLNLGILFCFKYYDFFIENVNAVFGSSYGFWGLALPLGISFYTFQQLSYVIDSYKRTCEQYSLLEYAAYVSFFPQLVAGPIVYHDELIPQLQDRKKHSINYENMGKGIYAFSLGLAKKVLIADTLSKIVTVGYDNVNALNAVSTVVVMVCYALQIYFDFSGYCDIAYGIGFLFNVELPINFNSPYKAASIREFWDRWHMTLTRFFTKYVYIPLGGSRKGKWRTYCNVMVVFLVSGIWHGANWTFILWGVLNGLGNLFDRFFDHIQKKIPRMIRVGATFIFCCIAWSLFRAESLKQWTELMGRLKIWGDGRVYTPITDTFNSLLEAEILARAGLDCILERCPWFLLVVVLAVLLIACFFMRNTQEKVNDGRYGGKRIAATVLLFVWSVLSLSEVSEFLYFNF